MNSKETDNSNKINELNEKDWFPTSSKSKKEFHNSTGNEMKPSNIQSF
jgi:hypothetical protein